MYYTKFQKKWGTTTGGANRVEEEQERYRHAKKIFRRNKYQSKQRPKTEGDEKTKTTNKFGKTCYDCGSRFHLAGNPQCRKMHHGMDSANNNDPFSFMSEAYHDHIYLSLAENDYERFLQDYLSEGDCESDLFSDDEMVSG